MGEIIILPKDELKHYGVMGMKWDHHKGNDDRAFDKAVAKDKKLQYQIQDAYSDAGYYSKKAAKYVKKSRTSDNPKYAKKAEKYSQKAERKVEKAQRLEHESKRWRKSMEKVFKNTSSKDISPWVKDRGRKYLYMLNDSTKKSLTKKTKSTKSDSWKSKPITPITMSTKGIRNGYKR